MVPASAGPVSATGTRTPAREVISARATGSFELNVRMVTVPSDATCPSTSIGFQMAYTTMPTPTNAKLMPGAPWPWSQLAAAPARLLRARSIP